MSAGVAGSFNRTSVELKPRAGCCAPVDVQDRFNRTSVELKPVPDRIIPRLRNQALIEPVWN